MNHYAFNLSDWTAHREDVILTMLLANVIPDRITVNVEPGSQVDGAGVIMQCDEDRAAAIVEIVHKKYHRNLMRFYRRKEGNETWKRV